MSGLALINKAVAQRCLTKIEWDSLSTIEKSVITSADLHAYPLNDRVYFHRNSTCSVREIAGLPCVVNQTDSRGLLVENSNTGKQAYLPIRFERISKHESDFNAIYRVLARTPWKVISVEEIKSEIINELHHHNPSPKANTPQLSGLSRQISRSSYSIDNTPIVSKPFSSNLMSFETTSILHFKQTDGPEFPHAASVSLTEGYSYFRPRSLEDVTCIRGQSTHIVFCHEDAFVPVEIDGVTYYERTHERVRQISDIVVEDFTPDVISKINEAPKAEYQRISFTREITPGPEPQQPLLTDEEVARLLDGVE